MRRRDFLTTVLAGTSLLRLHSAHTQESSGGIFLERAAVGTPHKGKVLLAVQAHSDDVSLWRRALSPSSFGKATRGT